MSTWRYPRRGRPAMPHECMLATAALTQLASERLAVVLIDASDPHYAGHKVRAVESVNPAWYRHLVARRPVSHSIRGYVTRALRAVAGGYVPPSPWSMAEEVLDVLADAR